MPCSAWPNAASVRTSILTTFRPRSTDWPITMLNPSIRSGSLHDAVRFARSHALSGPDARVELAELLYLTGDLEGAKKTASVERSEHIGYGLRCRLAMVRSGCFLDNCE